MGNNIRNYRITANNCSEIVQSDKVEFMPNTGQTLFYLEGVLLHIAPSSALVTDTSDQDEIIRKHEKISYFIHFEFKEIEKFWSDYTARGQFYDAKDEDLSEADRLGRIENRIKSKYLEEISKYVIKN
jgi:hypothetical protein